jgi:parvulin-like peptidyl-prolyl isomerase
MSKKAEDKPKDEAKLTPIEVAKRKNADREKEEEKDLEEEEDEDDEDDDDEEEDEEVERPAAKAVAGKSRPRARPAVDARPASQSKASSHDHDDDHEDEDEEEEASDEEDAYWWTPHAVMSALVLVGVLGFFGAFNKVLAGIAAHPAAAAAAVTTTTVTTTAAANKGAPSEQRDEFGAKHLLVAFKGSTRAAPTITRTDDEAKVRATEALKKSKNGAKFEDLVKEYSDEPGAAARGGDLGKFRKGRMDPVFQAAVEKLKVGEVSDLVKTQFGYHIIMRTQ